MKAALHLLIVASSLVALVVIGTVAYHTIEGWGYVDAFYFTGITVTTIGYGDLVPTHDVSKIFTVFFAFGGVAIALYTFGVFSKFYFDRKLARINVHTIEENIAKAVHFHKVERLKKKNDIIEGSRH